MKECLIVIFHGATARCVLGPGHFRGFMIALIHYVGLLWTNDQPDAGTST